MNFTITKPNFSDADLARVDPRILQFTKGWKILEQWEGKDVVLPDYVIFNYFEALNKPEGIQDDEKQLTIWCGWAGRSNGINIDGLYDAEVIITLSVNGQACHDPTIQQVNAEVIKSGGTTMQVWYNDKLVTDFQDTHIIDFGWWCGGKKTLKYPNGYQTRSMYQYL